MTTEVILTGTGVPHPSPGRAGPGTLVRSGPFLLQFDAGRATLLRLTEAGVRADELTAAFMTHVHSDHLVGLPDLVLTRWVESRMAGATPLPIVTPEGAVVRFVERMLLPYEDDIALRMVHVQPEPPTLDLRPFVAGAEPCRVWSSDDGTVHVDAVIVHHEPVPDAVAYRVTTPDGVVVISGDTRVCAEVESLSRGADVLVHEAARTSALQDLIRGTDFEAIFSYHADTALLGGLAERAGIRHLVLTHLIPPPNSAEESAAFEADIRASGFTGRVTVGTDLDRIAVGG